MQKTAAARVGQAGREDPAEPVGSVASAGAVERKLVFLDVDGTITTYENVIPDSAALAIRQARERGHEVYLATGRSRAENPPELDSIGFDGMIGVNGAYIERHGDIICERHFSPDQCRRVVAWLQERGLEFYLESGRGLIASERFREAARPVLREYARRRGEPDAAMLDTDDLIHGLVYGAPLCRGDVNKVSFILSTRQDHLDASAAFPDLAVGTWGGRGGVPLFGEFVIRGVNKGAAVRALVDQSGASMGDTIAVGDAQVDIPMLRACAVGVAMGGAAPEVRAVADYVTCDVDDDGLWRAFVHLGLAG